MAFLQAPHSQPNPTPSPCCAFSGQSGREGDLLSFITYQIQSICVIIYHMINGRNTDGKFTDGNGGRPKGSRNKATIAIDSLLEGQAEALTQTAISKALDGDSIALRLCMDRIAPPMKDKPVVFPLPQMRDAMDASQAAGSVLSAVSDGTLTPIEGTRVMGLIDSYRRTLELTDIEQRLQSLESDHADH